MNKILHFFGGGKKKIPQKTAISGEVVKKKRPHNFLQNIGKTFSPFFISENI